MKRSRQKSDMAILDAIVSQFRNGYSICAELLASYNELADRVYQPTPSALAGLTAEVAELRRRVAQIENKRPPAAPELPERLPLA